MSRFFFSKPASLMQLALLAAVAFSAVVLLGGERATATHPQPTLPLTRVSSTPSIPA